MAKSETKKDAAINCEWLYKEHHPHPKNQLTDPIDPSHFSSPDNDSPPDQSEL